ncbi:MAG: hypothetical protein SRB2_01408 [Desulfobacteraceae bacterium Eth-SRB2]|nr:MAG: hypothetical protein SRB2_01408 [Desulfobacteraceae bacterium Eth-SRB2]
MAETDQNQISNAERVRKYLKENPDKTTADVVAYFLGEDIEVKASYVRNIKSRSGLSKKRGDSKKKDQKVKKQKQTPAPKYPRHNLERALRIPGGILEQNAGRECTDAESASFLGIKYNRGPFLTELSSCIKFGLLKRHSQGRLELTEVARNILRPQDPEAKLSGLREAVQKAPEICEVYEHYRGENLPDDEFFTNALIDKFRLPETSVSDFKNIFFESLKFAKLIEEKGEKSRVIDATSSIEPPGKAADRLKAIGKGVKVKQEDICFVMMPFADPIGQYYSAIYKPAIEKAGLTPFRADDEIFSTGKIIDQIWKGINSAKVLVAELTSRNANVFYELGLAHALQKPVVLVSSNEEDVPFDLHHIRVIYYNMTDPFWGQKLIDKIAENVISALKNPEEALFKTALAQK